MGENILKIHTYPAQHHCARAWWSRLPAANRERVLAVACEMFDKIAILNNLLNPSGKNRRKPANSLL
jgi:hypothetical protein